MDSISCNDAKNAISEILSDIEKDRMTLSYLVYDPFTYASNKIKLLLEKIDLKGSIDNGK